MNRQQMLDALAAGQAPIDVAIRKWEDIANGEGENGANCSLCHTYQRCDQCPVSGGESGCCEGLYDVYCYVNTSEERNSAALDMVRYLKQKKLLEAKPLQSEVKPL
jgi:hypothetical protein